MRAKRSSHSCEPESILIGHAGPAWREKGDVLTEGKANDLDDAVYRAQAGDGRAFDALYEANVGRVYALCLRMSGDRRSAEELTQDVFVRAWRRIVTFRGASAFSTWLHRVAVNVVLDERKRRSRRPAELTSEGNDELAAASGVPTDPAIRLDLERALATLPERSRMALVLYAVEGYRYEEVAELMDISVGTVKSHIHRGRAQLMERMGDE